MKLIRLLVVWKVNSHPLAPVPKSRNVLMMTHTFSLGRGIPWQGAVVAAITKILLERTFYAWKIPSVLTIGKTILLDTFYTRYAKFG